ncbi:MAG: hypothetical protein KBT27_11150 [Prevotellaceae bacterium]|nr:hypothetical protein [Candidatus Faecinaster equi]
MNKIYSVLFILACTLISFNATAGKKAKINADTDHFRYSIEYAKTAADGLVMVKVWSYSRSKKASLAEEQCKKNAVHGIIFKGCAGSTASVSLAPLVKDAVVETNKAEFFKEFFKDGGDYMRYVSDVLDAGYDSRRVGNEYKVGVVVTVNRDMLRKHLEQAGIARGLASIF